MGPAVLLRIFSAPTRKSRSSIKTRRRWVKKRLVNKNIKGWHQEHCSYLRRRNISSSLDPVNLTLSCSWDSSLDWVRRKQWLYLTISLMEVMQESKIGRPIILVRTKLLNIFTFFKLSKKSCSLFFPWNDTPWLLFVVIISRAVITKWLLPC